MSDLKNNTINFLSNLEGYHQRLKEIHWSTTCNAEHKLTDDMDEDILEFQDRIAEAVMGAIDVTIEVGDLKTMSANSKTVKDLIKELRDDIKSFRKDAEEYDGVINALDDFAEHTYSWNYKRRFS